MVFCVMYLGLLSAFLTNIMLSLTFLSPMMIQRPMIQLGIEPVASCITVKHVPYDTNTFNRQLRIVFSNVLYISFSGRL